MSERQGFLSAPGVLFQALSPVGPNSVLGPLSHFYITRRHDVSVLLKLALGMDWISGKLSKIATWAVLAAALISAGNAFIRYGIDLSSNAWLEIQWYLFAATVMFGAPLVMLLNEHVRVDIVYGKLRGNKQVYVDILGFALFLLPAMGLIAYLSWPLFMRAFVSGEMSGNAGGLIRWPVLLLMPVGFLLMFLQGLAEIIKRVAYLQGIHQMSTHYEKPVQ